MTTPITAALPYAIIAIFMGNIAAFPRSRFNLLSPIGHQVLRGKLQRLVIFSHVRIALGG
jgi:hypothetical protein